MRYKSWYDRAKKKDELKQGDLIESLPIPIFPRIVEKTEKPIKIPVQEHNIIVMSQSCDIRKKKFTNIVVCNYQTLEEFSKEYTNLKGNEDKQKLLQGYSTGFHMIQALNTVNFKKKNYLVVNFREIFIIDKSYLKGHIMKRGTVRYRLRSPYLERLSQDFGRFFMRVGVTETIPPFVKES